MATLEYQPFFEGEAGIGFRESGSKTDRSASGRRLQAVQIRLSGFPAFFVVYDVRLSDSDWMGRVSTLSGEGSIRGDVGNPSRFVDAVFFDLVDLPLSKTSLKYQVKWANAPSQWSGYFKDGESLMKRGVGIVGIEIKLES